MPTTEIGVYAATAVATIVVLVTRFRVRPGRAAGRFLVGKGLRRSYEGFGVLGLLLWGSFLYFPEDQVLGSIELGIVALGMWWSCAACGWIMASRWFAGKGRHSQSDREMSWWRGPGLAILGNTLLLIALAWMTWGYVGAYV